MALPGCETFPLHGGPPYDGCIPGILAARRWRFADGPSSQCKRGRYECVVHPYDTSASEASDDVVVAGASAGGLPALLKLATGLGEDFVLPNAAVPASAIGWEPARADRRTIRT